MKINGWDIVSANAKQWNVTPGFRPISNNSEWARGHPEPFLTGNTTGFKMLKITLLIKADRSGINYINWYLPGHGYRGRPACYGQKPGNGKNSGSGRRNRAVYAGLKAADMEIWAAPSLVPGENKITVNNSRRDVVVRFRPRFM